MGVFNGTDTVMMVMIMMVTTVTVVINGEFINHTIDT